MALLPRLILGAAYAGPTSSNISAEDAMVERDIIRGNIVKFKFRDGFLE